MYLTEFLTIAIAHLLAVASPGPDFALVLRQSAAHGRTAGLWTSAGIAVGILVHVSYCLLGVAVLLASSENLFTAMKLIAAAYLLYLGVTAVRDSFHVAATALTETASRSLLPRQLFLNGFITNGLNPKATLFFLALFTVVISRTTPLPVQILYGIYLSAATFCWFAALSSLLGQDRVRSLVLKSGGWFERAMGIVLIGLALQLAISMLPA
ncbi:MAG: LysE family transporter [Pseudohongiellaceae bacterium]